MCSDFSWHMERRWTSTDILSPHQPRGSTFGPSAPSSFFSACTHLYVKVSTNYPSLLLVTFYSLLDLSFGPSPFTIMMCWRVKPSIAGGTPSVFSVCPFTFYRCITLLSYARTGGPKKLSKRTNEKGFHFFLFQYHASTIKLGFINLTTRYQLQITNIPIDPPKWWGFYVI